MKDIINFFPPQVNSVAAPPPAKQPEPVEPKPVQVPKVSTTAPKPEKTVEKAEKPEEKKEATAAAPQIINNDKEATVTPAKTDVSAGTEHTSSFELRILILPSNRYTAKSNRKGVPIGFDSMIAPDDVMKANLGSSTNMTFIV